MEIALRSLLPRIVPGVSFDIHVFQGKPDLMKKIGSRLAGYRDWLPEYMGIVVIVDRDQEDCIALKAELENAALKAGLKTASTENDGPFQVLNRIAVEELEAWFFGDVPALAATYAGVSKSLDKRAPFRDPDAISGGTAEALERVLAKAGHFGGGLSKTRAAREISARMNVNTNRSKSFCVLRDGLRRLVNQKEETR